MLYCPYCLKLYYDNDKEVNADSYNGLNQRHCIGCLKDVTLEQTPHSLDYYKQLSINEYNCDWRYDIFIERDIINNPCFNQECYNRRIRYEEKRSQRIVNNMLNSNPKYKGNNPKHQPKCPVCSSPNIRKISLGKRAVHGTAFGLFSKTARSQWECLNCGNKF